MKTNTVTIDTTRWSRCNRDTRKLDSAIKKTCFEKEIPLKIRQVGSHRIYQTLRGSISMPMHGELPKGTWGSIFRALVALGIASITLFLVLIQAAGAVK